MPVMILCVADWLCLVMGPQQPEPGDEGQNVLIGRPGSGVFSVVDNNTWLGRGASEKGKKYKAGPGEELQMLATGL